ncbi:MAG: hypothetical protein GX267_07940 [Fibrobacter sp.]|jgi:hypothetical protein|nr:hypothetical protein [Fibrobacter sp.]
MIFTIAPAGGRFVFLIYTLFFLLLMVQCERQHILTEDPNCISFDPNSMRPQGIVDKKYVDTVHLSPCFSYEKIVISPLNNDINMQVTVDSIFAWIPRLSDTGLVTIQCEIIVGDKIVDTISWDISVVYWPEECAPYTHKDDAIVMDASMLPSGYFIYSRYSETGIYRSEIQHFEPHLIPNTSADLPGNLSISDDGKWICYVDRSRKRICLVTINGCNKTIVPVSDVDSGYPMIAGFYRGSPYASENVTEIYYLASPRILKSVRVDLSKDVPVFSNDRILADLQESYCFRNADFMQLSVVKDQVFGEINPVVGSNVYYRTGYLTIPDGGRGIGGPKDVYKWKDDFPMLTEGCGHTQSHDGKYCLANPGGVNGNPKCVPHTHNGFYITEFRRITDTPINFFTDHIDRYGVSINWCPPQYQEWPRKDVDFWGWYFSNDNDYVIGRQMGYLNENGVWMIDWRNNIWYRLTPVERNILTQQPAVYFYTNNQGTPVGEPCEEDTSEKPLPYDPTIDEFNPNYKILYPNGGEAFVVGQQCTVKVTTIRSGNAMLNITFNDGLNWSLLPGLDRSINPAIDTQIVFTIPDSVSVGRGKKISTVSDNCWIEILDYGNSNFKDLTDGPFSIKKK